MQTKTEEDGWIGRDGTSEPKGWGACRKIKKVKNVSSMVGLKLREMAERAREKRLAEQAECLADVKRVAEAMRGAGSPMVRMH